MCLELVERVVREELYERLAIPPAFRPYVEKSWERREPTIYGRFDLWYDGRSDPKLLEFNADTPTALFEASIVQYYWLQDYAPHEDQFNSIHEKLLDVLQSGIAPVVGRDVLYFLLRERDPGGPDDNRILERPGHPGWNGDEPHLYR